MVQCEVGLVISVRSTAGAVVAALGSRRRHLGLDRRAVAELYGELDEVDGEDVKIDGAGL